MSRCEKSGLWVSSKLCETSLLTETVAITKATAAIHIFAFVFFNKRFLYFIPGYLVYFLDMQSYVILFDGGLHNSVEILLLSYLLSGFDKGPNQRLICGKQHSCTPYPGSKSWSLVTPQRWLKSKHLALHSVIQAEISKEVHSEDRN